MHKGYRERFVDLLKQVPKHARKQIIKNRSKKTILLLELGKKPIEEQERFLRSLTGAQRNAIYSQWEWIARPNQLAPQGSWTTWLLLAGRGFGKSRTAKEWLKKQILEKPGNYQYFARTDRAVSRDITNGDECLLKMIGLENVIRGNTRDYIWEFKNGSVLLGGTGERPDNARGNSLSGAVFDELAFYHNSQDCLDIVDYALRKGDGKKVITTTPSQHALLLLKKIINDPDTVTTKGSSWENLQNIEGTVLSSLKKTDGTQLANMEIYADLVSLEGKLFKQDWIGRANNPDCQTIVVSWDPAISSDRNYNGIIVMGKSGDEGYVLADRSIRGSAEEVSKAVVKAYHDFKANYIIIEKNNGGDWLPFAIRVVDKNIPIKTVTATRGKHLRAEPVSQMYEKGMFKHCGYFRDLEEQMISYDPATKINSSQSPDRLDALVWAATFLFNEDCADNIGALQNIDGFDLSENWM